MYIFITFAVQGCLPAVYLREAGRQAGDDGCTRNGYKNILVNNLAYCQKNKGLGLFAWCIMTNHVHLIARAEEGHSLPDILHDYKKFTGKAVCKAIIENQRESRKEWLIMQFETELRFCLDRDFVIGYGHSVSVSQS